MVLRAADDHARIKARLRELEGEKRANALPTEPQVSPVASTSTASTPGSVASRGSLGAGKHDPTGWDVICHQPQPEVIDNNDGHIVIPRFLQISTIISREDK